MTCHLSCVLVLALGVYLRLGIIQPPGHFTAFWHCQALQRCCLETLATFQLLINLRMSKSQENTVFVAASSELLKKPNPTHLV